MTRPSFRYWNSDRQTQKFFSKHRWWPKLGETSPGYIGDLRNRLPGGFLRFERFQKLPVAAWKLYWRRHRNSST